MNTIRLPALIALLVAPLVIANVSVAASFTVKTAPCKGFVLQDKKWTPMPELPFSGGERLEVRPVSGRSDIVYWKKDGTDYTVPVKCLASADGTASTAARASGASRARAQDAGGSGADSRTSWNLQISALSWQETINLTASDDRIYPLTGNHIGTCVGGGFQGAIWGGFDYLVDACGMYMTSHLGNTDADNADVRYEATGSTVLGLKTQIGALWHTDSRFFSVGVSAPIVYRYGNWPVPPVTEGITYGLGNQSTLLTGIALESRLAAGSFLFIPRAGFLGSVSNFMWEIGFGYSL